VNLRNNLARILYGCIWNIITALLSGAFSSSENWSYDRFYLTRQAGFLKRLGDFEKNLCFFSKSPNLKEKLFKVL